MYKKSCGKNVLCIAYFLVLVIVEYKLSELFCTFVGFSLLLVTTFISKILSCNSRILTEPSGFYLS